MLSSRQLTILDGAFFAHRSWHTKGRSPLAAFVHHVTQLIVREAPDLLVAAWDAPGPNFRHELWPEYKANREEKSPELEQHILDCEQALRLLGVPVHAASGFEGDDVVATFTERWKGNGGRVRVHTADKDLLQLVQPGVTLVLRGQDFDREGVIERWGVPPEQIADLLALAGDAVDGIPGIPGIGALTAAKLLSTWGSIEGIYEQLHLISGARRDALREHREQLELFRQLTRLDCEAPVPLHPEELLFVPDLDAFGPFCREREIWPEPLARPYQERLLVWQERVAIMAESGVTEERARARARHDCIGLMPGC